MRVLSGLAGVSLLLVLSGCHITSHKNGDSDNVNIGTPFGSMQVKTNDNVEASGIGITPYPGARIVKKDKDDGAADVNMSFGSFHLGVKAASYTTSDPPDKVLAFYQKDLGRYGIVLECNGKHTASGPARTAEGLTCDYDDSSKGGHISWDTDVDRSTELRTGSKQHQHIVAVQTKDGATKIGMVALDLPTGLSDKKDKQSD